LSGDGLADFTLRSDADGSENRRRGVHGKVVSGGFPGPRRIRLGRRPRCRGGLFGRADAARTSSRVMRPPGPCPGDAGEVTLVLASERRMAGRRIDRRAVFLDGCGWIVAGAGRRRRGLLVPVPVPQVWVGPVLAFSAAGFSAAGMRGWGMRRPGDAALGVRRLGCGGRGAAGLVQRLFSQPRLRTSIRTPTIGTVSPADRKSR